MRAGGRAIKWERSRVDKLLPPCRHAAHFPTHRAHARHVHARHAHATPCPPRPRHDPPPMLYRPIPIANVPWAVATSVARLEPASLVRRPPPRARPTARRYPRPAPPPHRFARPAPPRPPGPAPRPHRRRHSHLFFASRYRNLAYYPHFFYFCFYSQTTVPYPDFTVL